MKVKSITRLGDWLSVKGACLSTIGKGDPKKEPTYIWKRNLLLSEHSPIRKLHFNWKWVDLLSWVSVHFTRHKFGIDHFVSTQRTDRTGEDRNSKRQDELVMHEVEANAQALINVSRKRLCECASIETQEAWKEIKRQIRLIDEAVASCMVVECVYRGHCYEMESCGYYKTEGYQKELAEYRANIN